MSWFLLRTWKSYGLCPFQPDPGNGKMLFDEPVDEDCRDSSNTTRFVPCLFSAGFSCIMVFLDDIDVISGCIRPSGDKLVTFEASPNTTVKHVVTLDNVTIYNSCSAREHRCAPSEVFYGNTTAIYSTCCCNGSHCTTMEGYRDDDTITEEDKIPFHDVHLLFILAFCYATTAAALTISLTLTLYKAYTNRLILKNR